MNICVGSGRGKGPPFSLHREISKQCRRFAEYSSWQEGEEQKNPSRLLRIVAATAINNATGALPPVGEENIRAILYMKFIPFEYATEE